MANRTVIWTILALLTARPTPGVAATTVAFTGVPTPGASQFVSWTGVASSDAGKIIGFNFDQTFQPGFGFHASQASPFKQLDPFGFQIIFNNPALWVSAPHSSMEDTHFLVEGSQGLITQAAESTTYLGGAFEFSDVNSGTSSLSFVNLNLPAGVAPDSFQYAGTFTVLSPAGARVVEQVSSVPEPSLWAGWVAWMLMVVASRRQNWRILSCSES